MFRQAVWTIAVLAFLCATVNAADNPSKDEHSSDRPEERSVTTRHEVEIDGRDIEYEATVGTLFLKDEENRPRASMFYVAYERLGVDSPGDRPVTFVFNGGPGSSAVWLHLGAFGPRRVTFEQPGQPAPAPYTLENNDASLLDRTDLVFIDPVGTGYSRTLGEAEPKEFLGVREDVKSVGEFIRLYLARNERWNSPKFLAGESYGTTRAAALAAHLQRRGIFVNGVALISSILNFQTARFETGNDLPYILYLPSYAATAWYHEALDERPEDLDAFLDEVRRFARDEYAAALMKGAQLGGEERDRVIARLAGYTGLSERFIREANMRIGVPRFTKELLRDRRRTVGRLDSRYRGIDRDAAGESFQHDPSYTAIVGPYTAAMNDYLARELDYDEDREYEVLSFEVNRQWNWDVPGRAGYVNVAEDLRRAMSTNTHLEVLVANGYYDLATPFFATEYTMDHLGLEPSLRDNLHMRYYPAGHMMYVQPESLQRLREHMVEFIDGAAGKNIR